MTLNEIKEEIEEQLSDDFEVVVDEIDFLEYQIAVFKQMSNKKFYQRYYTLPTTSQHDFNQLIQLIKQQFRNVY